MNRSGLLKALSRRITRSRFARWMVTQLVYFYVALVRRTTRWTIEGEENRTAFRDSGSPVIAAMWHGRILMAPPLIFGMPQRPHALVSANRDGEMIAMVLARFGITAVRGSSRNPERARRNKGGGESLGALAAALRAGGLVGVTPDGPRGPRMRAKPGIAVLSVRTQTPVVPLAYSKRNARIFQSWDRFMAPLPFGKGAMVIGAPLTPPDRNDPALIEAFRREIETALNTLTQHVDRQAGRVPVEPAPESDLELAP